MLCSFGDTAGMDLRELPDNERFRRHPWETVRARFFRRLIRELGAADARTVLDIGAGDGWLAQDLLKEFPAARVTCWDTRYEKDKPADTAAARFVSERPEGAYDAVLLLDLLEHVEDDGDFLRGVVDELAKPGAFVLVSVPAWQGLFSGHDTAFTHHRRYDPGVLRDLLAASGLSIVREGGLFHALMVPRAAKVGKERLFGPGDTVPRPLHWRHGEWSARLLESILGVETAVSAMAARRGAFIPGLSHWAVCVKGSPDRGSR